MALLPFSLLTTACMLVVNAAAPKAEEARIAVVRTTDNQIVFLLPDADKPGHYDRAIAIFFKEQPPVANLPATLPAGSVYFSDHDKNVVLAYYGRGMVIFGLEREKTSFKMKEMMDSGVVQQAETYLGYGISDTNGDWDANKVKAAGALDLEKITQLNERVPSPQR